MSEEKKTAVTEEVKEEVRKLTEEELEQVSGGCSHDVYDSMPLDIDILKDSND